MSDWNPQANELFLEAIDRPSGPVRDSFLDLACNGDADLRAHVDRLLDANERASEFLSASAEESLRDAFEQMRVNEVGNVIGPYKLLEQLGEGGMGSVYLAEQSQPVRRTVALKIVKAGMDSAEVSTRFEAERQVLALMDHPNIARVIDAGTTGPESRYPGRPYFVMELVRGVPIAKFCETEQLTLRQRLELFLPVCNAIQHAHQKGVIHRDLKPTNVLVSLYDGRHVPKVIDFGVAKATAAKLTEHTFHTEFGALIGTLEYMSPEQAHLGQIGVDTRSDIYSLGVLLYELLTGETPHDAKRLRSAGFDKARQIIREEEPPRPSTRLESSRRGPAKGRQPEQLFRELRGDLDWIVLKALEKDRSRRYQTVVDLARDIERYLNHCEIEARPPSAIYRFRKFARRNRLVLTAIVLVSATLIIATVVSATLAIRATKATRLAEAARADEAIHRKDAEQRRIEAQQARAAEAVQRKIAEDERNAAERRRAQMERGFHDSRIAIDAYFSALRANKTLNEPSLQRLRKELLASALAYYRQFIDRHQEEPALEAELANAYFRIGELNREIGSKQVAIDAFQQAIQRYEHLVDKHPEHSWGVAAAYEQLGNQQQATGQLVDAGQSFTRALANWQKATHEPDYQLNVARAWIHLGNVQRLSEQFVEAEESFRLAFEIYERLESEQAFPSEYRMYLADAHYLLGALQRTTGRFVDAEASIRQTIHIYEQLANDDPTEPNYSAGIAAAAYQLGHLQRIKGDHDAARKCYARALELYEALVRQDLWFGSHRRSIGGARFHLGLLESMAGRNEEAIENWTTALADFDAAAELGLESAGFLASQADTLAMLGRWQEAAAVLSKAVAADDDNWRLRCQLALLYWAAGDEDRYRAACEELLVRRAAHATGKEASAIVFTCLVHPGAVGDRHRVLALAQRASAADPSNPIYQMLVGAAYYRAGQVEPAQRLLEQLLPLLAVAEKSSAPMLDNVRASRIVAETILMLIYRTRTDEAGLARQARSVQELTEKGRATAPVYCDEGDIWRVAFSVLFAERELARGQQSSDR